MGPGRVWELDTMPRCLTFEPSASVASALSELASGIWSASNSPLGRAESAASITGTPAVTPCVVVFAAVPGKASGTELKMNHCDVPSTMESLARAPHLRCSVASTRAKNALNETKSRGDNRLVNALYYGRVHAAAMPLSTSLYASISEGTGGRTCMRPHGVSSHHPFSPRGRSGHAWRPRSRWPTRARR